MANKIYENLQTLHAFQRGRKSPPEGKLQIRIYSALPPVQMYQADDHIVVSFYPLNSTSWDSTQYQTTPHAQLGAFVSEKFNELWDAPSTRMLGQFRKISLRVGLDNDPNTYPVEFVTSDEVAYVCGQSILGDHWEHGLEGLRSRIVENGHEMDELYFFLCL